MSDIIQHLHIPNIEIMKKNLIELFEDNRDQKLQQYRFKNKEGEILGTRDYYEMYFSYDERGSVLDSLFPFPCRGYQYVFLPPNYEMVVHKDIEYLKCRIGLMLYGTAPLLIYDREQEPREQLLSYDYREPALVDVSQYHNVKNDEKERLTFFVNFETSFKQTLSMLREVWPQKS